jgi:hypothetical protein
MSFEDFFREFDSIDFVHINLNAFYNVGKEYERMIEWDNKFFTGAWVKGKTAGGLYLLTNILIRFFYNFFYLENVIETVPLPLQTDHFTLNSS